MYYVIDNKMYVICFRVADMPKPRVTSGPGQRCANCSTRFWVGKSGLPNRIKSVPTAWYTTSQRRRGPPLQPRNRRMADVVGSANLHQCLSRFPPPWAPSVI